MNFFISKCAVKVKFLLLTFFDLFVITGFVDEDDVKSEVRLVRDSLDTEEHQVVGSAWNAHIGHLEIPCLEARGVEQVANWYVEFGVLVEVETGMRVRRLRVGAHHDVGEAEHSGFLECPEW